MSDHIREQPCGCRYDASAGTTHPCRAHRGLLPAPGAWRWRHLPALLALPFAAALWLASALLVGLGFPFPPWPRERP